MKKTEDKPPDLKRKTTPILRAGVKLIALPNIYSATIKKNYPKLVKKDPHIAEIYRVGAPKSPIPLEEISFNPFQVHLDKKNGVWVDVLIERKRGISLKELSAVMQIHGKPGQSKFISGRVKVGNLPKLNKKVLRMETSRPISKALNRSVKFIKANKNSLKNIKNPIDGTDITGEGVIIGIIDDGCDFHHPNFKKPNGDTRLLFLWDQSRNEPTQQPTNYPYGVEFDAAHINNALIINPNDPYGELGYTPALNAHGTHVMDIAAGKSANPAYLGVAPAADLIFVQLGSPTKPSEIEGEERGTFGSSKYLVDAFNYILEKAGNKAVVVNMSLAANGGAHNGKSLTDAMFNNQLQNKNRALVIAAGNAAQKAIHFSKVIHPNEICEIQWNMSGTEIIREKSWYTRYEMEIWYPKSKKMKVEIYKPNTNIPLLTCAYDEEQMSHESATKPLVLVTNSESTADEENHVNILVDHRSEEFSPGNWHIQLINEEEEDASAPESATIHAWIERNDRYPSTFNEGGIQEFTINGIGTANLPIVVGAYDDSNKHNATGYSSFGPSRNTPVPEKPEISAPGENITSARALRGNTVSATAVSAAVFTEQTSFDDNGTSMAAPHVAGVTALMFHAAKLAGRNDPKVEEIRNILKETANSNKKGKHNNQLGYGRINALEAIKQIIQN